METFLVQLIDVVNRKRFLLQRECDILQDILKPWTIKNSPNNPQQETREEVAKDTDETEKLSNAESQALSQVDQLLAKAQKALKLKEKLVNKENQETKENIERSSSEKSETKNNELSAPSSTALSANSHTKPKRPTQRSKQPEQPVQSTQTKSKETQKPSHSISKTTHSRPSSAANSSRPSSRSKSTPVHMTAPFKTDVNVRIPQRRAQQAAKNQLRSNKTKMISSAGMNSYRALPKIKTKSEAVIQIEESGKTEGWREAEEIVTEEKPNTRDVTEYGNSGSIKPVEDDIDSSSERNVNTSNCATAEPLEINTEEIKNATNPSLATLHVPRVFDLKTEGSNLNIPLRLKKLISTNTSLREKCKRSRLVKKVSLGDQAESFTNKLEAQSIIGQELRTRVAALTCLRRHEILLDTFNTLHLDEITETTNAEQIYKSKVILEFFLSKFAELEEEATFLSRVQFKEILPIQCKQQQLEESKSQWLTVGDTKVHSGMENTFGSQANEWIVDESLSYSTLWQHLEFTKQNLQLQIQLIDQAWLQWGKVVQQQPSDKCVLELIYGLTTTCGQFFPAFVNSID